MARVPQLEKFAARHWGGEDPIGRGLRLKDGGEERSATVVGVVGDVKDFLLFQEPEPQIYIPQAQQPMRAPEGGLICDFPSLVWGVWAYL